MDDALEDRVDALERAVTDDDSDFSDLATAGEITARLDDIESQIAEIERRVDELDGATQALRGYVGNIRSVNRDVEDRADAALAKVESLEAQLSGRDTAASAQQTSPSTPSRGDDRLDSELAADGQPSTERRQHERTHPSNTHNDGAGAAQTSSAHERRCDSCGRPRTTSDRPSSEAASDGIETQERTGASDQSLFETDTAVSGSGDALQAEPSATNGGSGPLERIRKLL